MRRIQTQNTIPAEESDAVTSQEVDAQNTRGIGGGDRTARQGHHARVRPDLGTNIEAIDVDQRELTRCDDAVHVGSGIRNDLELEPLAQIVEDGRNTCGRIHRKPIGSTVIDRYADDDAAVVQQVVRHRGQRAVYVEYLRATAKRETRG